jgi:hypothetical protein
MPRSDHCTRCGTSIETPRRLLAAASTSPYIRPNSVNIKMRGEAQFIRRTAAHSPLIN